MDDNNPPHGLSCSVTGTVIGKPLFRMVKNGTVPMLGATIRYDEYDGSTSVCRATLFGDRAQAMADKIKTGTRIHVEGTGAINTWEKDGEKRHGLSILARRAKVEDGDGEDSSGGRDVGVRRPQPPQVISSLFEEDGDDMFR